MYKLKHQNQGAIKQFLKIHAHPNNPNQSNLYET